MSNYIDIPIKDLVPGMVVARDVRDKTGRLLIRANNRINKNILKRMKKFNINSTAVYLTNYPIIVHKDNNKLSLEEDKYIDNNEKILDSDFQALKNQNYLNIYNTFYIQLGNIINISVRQILRPNIDIKTIKKTIMKAICSKNILKFLMKLKIKDQYLLVHSIEVGILCTAIGIETEMNEKRLRNLILAGLLHDIGMIEINDKILSKNTSLTMDEINIVRSHASKSVLLLSEHAKIDKEVLTIIFQHHERFNGTGYPKGLTESIINNSAKILSVCDVYSAISHQRSYRDKLTPQEKIEFFFASGDYYFNYDIVKLLLDKVSIYYKGQWVKLNTGQVGIISKVDANFQIRPYVKLIYDENGKQISKEKEIFLGSREYCTMYIEKIL